MYDWEKEAILKEIRDKGGLSDDFAESEEYQARLEPKPLWPTLGSHCWAALVRPLDWADKFLMVVGAALSFAARYRPGVEAAMNSLVWIVPVTIICVFVVERLVQAPIRAWRQLEDEKRLLREGPPMTLKRLAQEVVLLNVCINDVAEDVIREINLQYAPRLAAIEKRLSAIEKALGIGEQGSDGQVEGGEQTHDGDTKDTA